MLPGCLAVPDGTMNFQVSTRKLGYTAGQRSEVEWLKINRIWSGLVKVLLQHHS